MFVTYSEDEEDGQEFPKRGGVLLADWKSSFPKILLPFISIQLQLRLKQPAGVHRPDGDVDDKTRRRAGRPSPP